MTQAVVVVLKGYPRLSETFIAEELLGLQEAGLDLRIVALRRPTDDRVHPVHRAIAAGVSYLPEYLHQEPIRVLRAWWRVRRLNGMAALWRQFTRDLRRDLTRNRVRRFGQALVLAAEFPSGAARIHAHFIHTPASVAAYASLLLGVPWSCSAHAKDIWTTPAWELRDKLAASRWTVTCTRAGRDRLQAVGPPGKPVHLVYHGLRLDRFVPLPTVRPARDGRTRDDPVRLLSVGRAVEKKGFDVLLEALARLPKDCAWRWTHVGGGVLLEGLKARAQHLGLSDRIVFAGAQAQDAVLDHYRDADLFVLPCRVARDGDRDGLPNVLVEAQSQGLACISTDVGGVAELILPGQTGLLVPPDDPAALCAALLRSIGDPLERGRFGKAGARRVAADFDARGGLRALLNLFAETAPDVMAAPPRLVALP